MTTLRPVLVRLDVDVDDWVVVGDAASYVALQLGATRAVSGVTVLALDCETPVITTTQQWGVDWGDEEGPIQVRDEEWSRAKASADHGDRVMTRTTVTVRAESPWREADQ